MDDEVKIQSVLKKMQDKFVFANKGSDVAMLRIFKDDFPDEMGMDFSEVGRILEKIQRDSKGDVFVKAVESLSTTFSDFMRREQVPPSLLIERAFYNVRFVNRGAVAVRMPERGEVIFAADKGVGYVKRGAGKRIRISKHGTLQFNLLERFFTPKFGERVKKSSLYDYIQRSSDDQSTNYLSVVKATLKEINRTIKVAGFSFRLHEEEDEYWLEVEDGGK